MPGNFYFDLKISNWAIGLTGVDNFHQYYARFVDLVSYEGICKKSFYISIIVVIEFHMENRSFQFSHFDEM